MADALFPTRPADLDGLLEYLQRVRDTHGNMPLGVASGLLDGHLGPATVYVTRIGVGQGMKLVSRGGRDCLVIHS